MPATLPRIPWSSHIIISRHPLTRPSLPLHPKHYTCNSSSCTSKARIYVGRQRIVSS